MKKVYYSLFLILIAPQLALAQINGNYGLDAAGGSLPQGTGATFADKLAAALGSVIGSFLAFLGVIFLVLMIAGGFMWMMAGGDEKKVLKARNILVAAVVGLIIVLSAYAITAYLGDSVLGKI